MIIPDSVTEIGECAFEECTALKSITLPSSIEYIDEYAFAGSGIQSVDQSVFEGCTSLESVRIPKRAILIQPGAFANCTNLHTAIIEGEDTDIFEGFEDCPNLTIVCHRNSSAEEYAEDNGIPVNYIR